MKQSSVCSCPAASQGRIEEGPEIYCETVHQIAESLGKAIDAKDMFTSNHSRQVAHLSRCLALHLGLSQQQTELIHIAGHLHDIGKIGVPDAILAKEGPLTDAEWVLIKKHPVIGAKILAPIQVMNGSKGISQMVLHHHERWDGRGYPHGLSRTEIPLGARILALADSLSAMLESRPYRPGLGLRRAVNEIQRGAGAQFDPELGRVMTSMIQDAGCVDEECGIDLLVTRIMCRRVLGKRCDCCENRCVLGDSPEGTALSSWSLGKAG